MIAMEGGYGGSMMVGGSMMKHVITIYLLLLRQLEQPVAYN
jgi:hypothetical protein